MVFKTLTFFVLYFFCFSCGKEPTQNPNRSYRNHLDAKMIVAKLSEHKFSAKVREILEAKINEAAEAEKSGDQIRAEALLLQYNKLFETEYSKLYMGGANLESIKKRYSDLNSRRASFKPEKAFAKNKGARLNGLKIPDKALSNPFVYHPATLEQVLNVYRDFGRLYINETKNAEGKIILEQVESEKKPWAGHWYPYSRKNLYEDKKNSPLAKFDRLVNYVVGGHASKARAYQETMMRGLGGTSWEGLCDAWAFASVMSDEPTEELNINGIHFSIADQKALLTFSHLKYPFTQYGLQYAGGIKTDGTYDDIKPEAFHRVITSVLGVQKRAVVIDDMAGVEVWNKPLYKYRWKVQKDPYKRNAYLVTAYTWLVKERSKETNKLTNSRDILAPSYFYRLYVDKASVNNGKYLVVAGEWIGRSRTDHPDNIKVPHTKGSLGSHNPEFNKNLNVIERYFLKV